MCGVKRQKTLSINPAPDCQRMLELKSVSVMEPDLFSGLLPSSTVFMGLMRRNGREKETRMPSSGHSA